MELGSKRHGVDHDWFLIWVVIEDDDLYVQPASLGVDVLMLRLNLLLLLVVSFLPFPSQLLAEYVHEQGAEDADVRMLTSRLPPSVVLRRDDRHGALPPHRGCAGGTRHAPGRRSGLTRWSFSALCWCRKAVFSAFRWSCP